MPFLLRAATAAQRSSPAAWTKSHAWWWRAVVTRSLWLDWPALGMVSPRVLLAHVTG